MAATFILVDDFDLEGTLDSGQVFGFSKIDGFYEGFIARVPVRIRQEDRGILVESPGDDRGNCLSKPPSLREEDVRAYFDLDRDLGPIYDLLRREERLRPLGPPRLRGLRVVREEPWEAMAAFILSANNNIGRIKLLWQRLSVAFSHAMTAQTASFPGPGAIARSSESFLKRLGLGYRAPYLFKTARLVAQDPCLLRAIRQAPYAEALERLLEFPGIGPKVADCVLLHGFQKYEAFPVDIWIYRAMRKLYFPRRKPMHRDIHALARKKWGENAGYVQRYLYHGSRSGILLA